MDLDTEKFDIENLIDEFVDECSGDDELEELINNIIGEGFCI